MNGTIPSLPPYTVVVYIGAFLFNVIEISWHSYVSAFWLDNFSNRVRELLLLKCLTVKIVALRSTELSVTV